MMSNRKDAAALLARLPEAVQDQILARIEGAALALDVLQAQGQTSETPGGAA